MALTTKEEITDEIVQERYFRELREGDIVTLQERLTEAREFIQDALEGGTSKHLVVNATCDYCERLRAWLLTHPAPKEK